MAENSNSYGLAWFLAGIGVGAAVGVLFAPKSGRETREEIAAGARESTEYLRERTRRAAEEARVLAETGRAKVNEYVDRGREVVEQGRNAVDRGRAQWDEFVDRGKTLVSEHTSRVAAAVEAGRQTYRAGAATATEPSEG